jgi:hypothetical protein
MLLAVSAACPSDIWWSREVSRRAFVVAAWKLHPAQRSLALGIITPKELVQYFQRKSLNSAA